MSALCQILLQKPLTGTYKPGQTVTGIVKYIIEKPIEVKAITLSLIGKGKCSWSEREKVGKETRTVYYTGTEEYVSFFLSILEKKDENIVTLPPDTYERGFEFNLPSNIPSSYKDDISNITYHLKFKIFRPGLFKSDKRFYATIVVHSKNIETNDSEGPIVFGLKKTLFKPLSSKKHIVNVRAKIEKVFIQPGDTTNISFVVTNDTNIEIKSIKTELICTTTYTANCGHKKINTKVIEDFTVQTPSIPPEAIANLCNAVKTFQEMYSIQNLKIINREYKVKVTVRLPVPYVNSSVDISVLIGFRGSDATIAAGDEPPSYWEAMCEEEEVKGKDE